MAEEIKKKRKGDWLVPVLVLALIVGSFFIGKLSAQVEYLSKGTKAGAVAAAPTTDTTGGDVAGATDISVDALKGLAEELGLDKGKFSSCLDDGKYAQKVTDDQAYGSSVGVSGTPTFYINGVELVGAQPQSEFEKVIEAELKDGSGDKAIAGGSRKEVKTGVGPVRGGKDAKIKIVEFSDFECPFCTRAYPTVKAIEAKYGDKVSIEYRHYPLSFHPNAQKAGEAAECALEQGKFWEFHDRVFGGRTS